MKILVVDDEQLLVKGMKFNLENEGYTVETAYDGATAIDMAKSGGFDLIILDLMMPQVDGLTACMRIREFSNVPIIMLTARSEDADKIIGLESGADDYITKPFNILELKARIRALLRRSAGRADPILERGELRISPHTREVTYRGEPVILSSKEYALLFALAERQGVVWSRSQLEEKLYNWDNTVGSNAIEVHIHHLRKKLSDSAIKTVRGVGYLLET